MRAVVQRVVKAGVSIGTSAIAKTGPGVCILLGVARRDSKKEATTLAAKVAKLRIFEDASGKITNSLLDTGGEVLVVSQFTLLADCTKGRRPSFSQAAGADKGDELYQEFIRSLKDLGIKVETGVFGARMRVEIINDGPFTLILDTEQ